MRELRAGLVGLSNIAASRDLGQSGVLRSPMPNSHTAALAANAQVKIQAVADLREDRRKAFAAAWPEVAKTTRQYESHKSMLAHEALDLIVVATADHQHGGVVLDAARSWVKAILCEKPLATTVEECDALIAACRKHEVLLSVCHRYRFRPSFHAAAGLVRDKQIGAVKTIVGHLGGQRAMLFRNGTHLIDGVCFFAQSEPRTVMGMLDRAEGHVDSYRGDGGATPEGDPGGMAIIEFANGVRGIVNCTKGQQQSFRLEIIGEVGRIVIENSYRERTAGAGALVTLHTEGNAVRYVMQETNQREGLSACVEELVSALQTGRELVSSGMEARKAVAAICAILRSSASGTPVTLEWPEV